MLWFRIHKQVGMMIGKQFSKRKFVPTHQILYKWCKPGNVGSAQKNPEGWAHEFRNYSSHPLRCSKGPLGQCWGAKFWWYHNHCYIFANIDTSECDAYPWRMMTIFNFCGPIMGYDTYDLLTWFLWYCDLKWSISKPLHQTKYSSLGLLVLIPQWLLAEL